jgi:EmrB/QacA subfamily drug resistance transporter
MSSTHPYPRRWQALAVIATAQFLVIMDTSIIGVALPDMQQSLGFSPSDLSWVFNAYVIALAGLLLLGGKLSDLLGARRVFSAGFVILTASSLAAGLAPSAAFEIAARAAQGAGSALIAPAALTLLITCFAHDPRELGRAMAFYAAAAPAGGTAGVFLGGVLTEWLDWPWVFYVNVPIGVAVLLATPRFLPTGQRTPGRVDVVSAVTGTAALSLLVFGVVRAPEMGWTDPATVWSLIGGAVLLAVFVALQAIHRDPLMPLSIFRTKDLAAGNGVMALLGAAWVPMWFFMNLFLQQVLGYGAFQAGASLLPMTVLMMILMVGVTGRLVSRFGPRWVLAIGLLALAGGLTVLAGVDPDSTFVELALPGSLIAAVGMSLAYIPAMLSSMAHAQPSQAGLASGIVNTTYQVGSALGLAAMTAVATSAGANNIGDPAALTDGYAAAFTGAAAIALVAAALAATTIGRRSTSESERESTGEPALVG